MDRVVVVCDTPAYVLRFAYRGDLVDFKPTDERLFRRRIFALEWAFIPYGISRRGFLSVSFQKAEKSVYGDAVQYLFYRYLHLYLPAVRTSDGAVGEYRSFYAGVVAAAVALRGRGGVTSALFRVRPRRKGDSSG